MTSRERLLLRVFCAWTVYVWGTRIWNAVGDDTRSFAFKAVHVVLALVSVALAVASWAVITRVRRREQAAVEAGAGGADRVSV